MPPHSRSAAEGLAADVGEAKLFEALNHPDPEVRVRAVAVVAELTPSSAASMLRAMIHDPSSAVRAAAVSAAGRTASVALTASLIVALDDPEPEVRRAAASAVSRVTGQTVTLDEPGALLDRAELSSLKLWWKAQRFTELALRTKP